MDRSMVDNGPINEDRLSGLNILREPEMLYAYPRTMGGAEFGAGKFDLLFDGS